MCFLCGRVEGGRTYALFRALADRTLRDTMRRVLGGEALRLGPGGEVDSVRSVASMLSELEDIWRGRIDRIDAYLQGD